MLLSALPDSSIACGLSAFAANPTSDKLYFQFSIDVPIDAWRVIVRPTPTCEE